MPFRISLLWFIGTDGTGTCSSWMGFPHASILLFISMFFSCTPGEQHGHHGSEMVELQGESLNVF